MEVVQIDSFLEYFEKIRQRTMRLVACIPPDKLEWSYTEGRFTLGDIARHIATVERYVFAEGVQGSPSRYPGCGPDLAGTCDEVVGLMNRLHRESIEIFSRLAPTDLAGKGVTADGHPVALGKLLRALIEHEVHHRGQMYAYLGVLGIATPPLYGITSEQLLQKSKQLPLRADG